MIRKNRSYTEKSTRINWQTYTSFSWNKTITEREDLKDILGKRKRIMKRENRTIFKTGNKQTEFNLHSYWLFH